MDQDGANALLYLELLDYFLDAGYLNFRCLVASKAALRHGDFGQTHDEWYYKMYFTMLQVVLNPHGCFRVYIDIANNLYDFSRAIVERVQIVRSHEVELMQLADVLVGRSRR